MRSQFRFFPIEDLSAFLNGVAGLFVVFSVSYLMISTTVVYDSASLAKKELRVAPADVA